MYQSNGQFRLITDACCSQLIVYSLGQMTHGLLLLFMCRILYTLYKTATSISSN